MTAIPIIYLYEMKIFDTRELFKCEDKGYNKIQRLYIKLTKITNISIFNNCLLKVHIQMKKKLFILIFLFFSQLQL